MVFWWGLGASAQSQWVAPINYIIRHLSTNVKQTAVFRDEYEPPDVSSILEARFGLMLGFYCGHFNSS